MQDLVIAFVNLGSLSSKEDEFKISRLVSLLVSTPFKNPGPSVDFEKVKGGGGALPKRDTNLELILF